jgi:hypothetical protein
VSGRTAPPASTGAIASTFAAASGEGQLDASDDVPHAARAKTRSAAAMDGAASTDSGDEGIVFADSIGADRRCRNRYLVVVAATHVLISAAQ